MRWIFCALALWGCGEPLFDEGYRGAPRFTLEGVTVMGTDDYHPDTAGPSRMALFWHVGDAHDAEGGAWVEDPATATPFIAPMRFTLRVYDLPGSAQRAPDARFAFGRVLIYRDDNEDGDRDPDEAWLGGQTGTAIAYAEGHLEADERPTQGPLSIGFTHLQGPLKCAGDPAPMGDAECGVDLGAQCELDADCGALGRCVKELYVPASRNVCVLPEPPPEGGASCQPREGRRVALGADLLRHVAPELSAAWLAACETPADCPRPGYDCALGLQICMPAPKLEVRYAPELGLPGICIDELTSTAHPPLQASGAP